MRKKYAEMGWGTAGENYLKTDLEHFRLGYGLGDSKIGYFSVIRIFF